MRNGFSVKHRWNQIVVTRSGTQFSAIYHKPDDQPNLVLLTDSIEPSSDRATIVKFRTDAFAAAMRKARELGWIV